LFTAEKRKSAAGADDTESQIVLVQDKYTAIQSVL
jgi:hypothetical protein